MRVLRAATVIGACALAASAVADGAASKGVSVTSVRLGATIRTAGERFQVGDTVRNRSAQATSALAVTYALHPLNGDNDIRLRGGRAIGVLAPGDRSSGHATVRIPTSTAGGVYLVRACVRGSHGATGCRNSSKRIAVRTAAAGPVPDTAAPAAPAVLGSDPASPGASQSPAIKGTAEPFATVRLYDTAGCGGAVLGSDAAGASGTWAISITVPYGQSRTLNAVAVDAAGNVSPCSSTSVTYQALEPPAAPVLTSFTPASPNRSATTPTLSGTAPAGSTVRVYRDDLGCADGAVAEDRADANGAFSVRVLAPANHTSRFTAVAIRDGLRSACSAPANYTHDSIDPVTPSHLYFSPPVAGQSSDPLLHGSAEPGTFVDVYRTGGCSPEYGPVASGPVDANGEFAIAVHVDHGDGDAYDVRGRDAAGNISGCSTPITYYSDPT